MSCFQDKLIKDFGLWAFEGLHNINKNMSGIDHIIVFDDDNKNKSQILKSCT